MCSQWFQAKILPCSQHFRELELLSSFFSASCYHCLVNLQISNTSSWGTARGSLCKFCCNLWSNVCPVPDAPLVPLCPRHFRMGKVYAFTEVKALVNTFCYKLQVSFRRSVIPSGCNTANCCTSHVMRLFKTAAISNDTFFSHCVCRFPDTWLELGNQRCHSLLMNANPTANVGNVLSVTLQLSSETQVSKAGARVQWSLPCPSSRKPWNCPVSSRQADRAQCSSFALLLFRPSDVHNLRASSGAAPHFPMGNFSASAGSHSRDIVLLVAAAAVLGRITSWILASCREAQMLPGQEIFNSWSHRKLSRRFLDAATLFLSGPF